MSRDRHPLGRPPQARAPSPHEILRVQPGASPAELRRAYRAAARSLHPDTNPSPDAAAQFAAVHQAWRALTDPGSRPTATATGGLARSSSPAADRCPTDCGAPSAGSEAGAGHRHRCVEHPARSRRRDRSGPDHGPDAHQLGRAGRAVPARGAGALGRRDPQHPAARVPGDVPLSAIPGSAPERVADDLDAFLRGSPTTRSVAWCSASDRSGPDRSGLLTLGASSIQTGPDRSCRIVWMTNG